MHLNILFEDRHIVVLEKPVGVLSQGAKDNGAPDLVSLLLERAREAGEADPRIHVVHRLDCGVGGAMVYAKKPYAAAILSAAAAGDGSADGGERAFLKEYLCVVEGVPAEACGELRDLLWKDAAKNKVFVVDRMRAGVREARLSYTLLGTRETEDGILSLLRIRLGTGRSHQIRVQLASRGLPIAGDGKYGARVRCGYGGVSAPALWSFRLAFEHPANAERHKNGRKPNPGAPVFPDPDILCMPPEDFFPFSLFADTLSALPEQIRKNI